MWRQGRDLVGSLTTGPSGEVPAAAPEVDAAQHRWGIELISAGTSAVGACNPAQKDVDRGGK